MCAEERGEREALFFKSACSGLTHALAWQGLGSSRLADAVGLLSVTGEPQVSRTPA